MKIQTYGLIENNVILEMLYPDGANDVPSNVFKIEHSGISEGSGSKATFIVTEVIDDVYFYKVVWQPDSSQEALEAMVGSGFSYQGNIYQFDEKARLNITGKALRLQLDNTDSITYWRTMDNQMVSFTKAEFIEFAKAVSDYYEQCFMESLTY